MLTKEQLDKVSKSINIPDAPGTNRTSRFKSAWGIADPIKSFKYDVEMPTLSKEEKVRRAESEAASSRAESDRLNSFGGFTKSFGSELLGNLAPSEVGLGQTIAKIGSKGGQAELNAINTLTDTRMKVMQAIREGKQAGEDTSRLEIQFNRTSDLIDQYIARIEEAGKLPTTKQALGQLGGTTLDILSSGTYGAAAAGARSFALAPRLSALPTTVQALRASASKPAGLFTLTGLKRVGEGAAIGYGYDITTNLREGSENVLTPGIGTAIGAGLPGLGALTASARRVAEPAITGGKTLFGKIDDSMRATAVDDLEGAWSNFFDSKKSTRKKIATEIAQGKDPARELAEGGYIPKVVNDKIDSTDIITKQTEQIAERMDAIDKYVAEFPDKNISLSSVQESARQALIDSPQVGPDLKKSLAELESFFDSYRMKYGDDIDLATVNQIRKDMNAKTKSYKTDKFTLDTADAVGKATRETLDNVTNSDIVRAVNGEIGRIGAARKMAGLIDGDAVKFGKVSRWAARMLGAVIGTQFNSPLGLGPLLGSIGGDAILSMLQQTAFTNPLRTRILMTIGKDEVLLQKIANETSEAAQAYLNKQLEKLRLPRLPAPNYIVAPEFKGGQGGMGPAEQFKTRPAETINKAPDTQSLRNSSTINQNATNAMIPNNPIDDKIIPQKGQTNPATLLGGAALTGGTMAMNASGKETIVNPAADNTPIIAGKAIEAMLKGFEHVETGTVKGDKYKFHKPSGNEKLGDDLGKYQVTEGELKAYSEKFLMRTVTKDEFLNSPDLQEEYMNNKIRFLLEEGLSPDAIFALHAQGMTGWGNDKVIIDKIKQANAQRNNYVNNALSVYNKNK